MRATDEKPFNKSLIENLGEKLMEENISAYKWETFSYVLLKQLSMSSWGPY